MGFIEGIYPLSYNGALVASYFKVADTPPRFSQQLAAVFAVGGSLVGVASWIEHRPSVLTWRLARELSAVEFDSTKRSDFSDLSRLASIGERPFSRITLEKQLVEKITVAIRNGQYCVVVAGPEGVGKSVFWEKLFKQRSVTGKEDSIWSQLPGPTRVVNLLKCTDLASFEAQVIDTFVPKTYLPTFGLFAPPTYEVALEVLEGALRELAKQNRRAPLILYIEDVNRLASFEEWQDTFVTLATAVASSGNGVIVGNSSALLAFRKFKQLSHTGLRTSSFFFPSIPSTSEELKEFSVNGGHLYAAGAVPKRPRAPLIGKSDIWNGNLVKLKHGTSDDEDDLRIKIALCLTVVNVFDNTPWRDLLDSEAPSTQILALRKGLLQLIADSPDKPILVHDVPPLMRQYKIVEQLAAMDLLTLRIPESNSYDVKDEKVEVVPYYPAVIRQYKGYLEELETTKAHAASGSSLA